MKYIIALFLFLLVVDVQSIQGVAHHHKILTCSIDGTLVYQSGPHHVFVRDDVYHLSDAYEWTSTRQYKQPENATCELTDPPEKTP